MKTTVLGAGSWGTSMAIVLARNGHEVRLLARSQEQISEMSATGRNEKYLPGAELPDSISFGLIEDSAPEGEMLVEALPSGAVRERLAWMGGYPIVCVATKGLEPHGGLLSSVIHEAHPQSAICLLSGPNLARELVAGIPTAAVAASLDEWVSMQVREAFHGPRFRVYITDDVAGVETAGALKNVMALAAGMSDGLGYGDNTKGTLLSRGLGEISRLGLAMGARLETFLGIAGVGDLFATATSRLSRNYRAGVLFGQGRKLEEVLVEIGQVAEGIPTCDSAVALARRLGAPVPIMEHVQLVIQGEMPARDAVGRLMERSTLREGIGDIIEAGSH